MLVSTSSVAAATTSVVNEVSGRCSVIVSRSWKKPCFAKWIAISLGNAD